MRVDLMVCCDQMYWCPTVRDFECEEHGGFSVCCSHPELHTRFPRYAFPWWTRMPLFMIFVALAAVESGWTRAMMIGLAIAQALYVIDHWRNDTRTKQ